MAAALAERVHRPMDLVARYGGEEFLIVVYGASRDVLEHMCEDLASAVRNLSIAHADNPPWNQVTVSIAAASAHPAAGSVTLETLINQADRALYDAKRLGRNRVALLDSAGPMATVTPSVEWPKA